MKAKTKKTSKSQHRHRYRHIALWAVGVLAAIVVLGALAFRLSPWPGAMVVRFEFEANGRKTTQALAKHQPTGVAQIEQNAQYLPGDPDAKLDVYRPQNRAGEALPVIIWTHGGAWLSGSKDNSSVYYQLLAEQGFVVVAPNYSLAPEQRYPTPIKQLNEAHRYVVRNAARYGADTNRIILAGDSAGAQLSAQLAAMITNPDYARQVGVDPALQANQLKGVVLNCGIYKMAELATPNPNLPKIVSWGTDVTVWAYSGTRDLSSPLIQQMSPYYYVTADFPPTYISGGNVDPLTKAQSMPLAQRLSSLGVPVSKLFYADNHQPALPHEYQFNLDNQDGQNALQATIEFAKVRTGAAD